MHRSGNETNGLRIDLRAQPKSIEAQFRTSDVPGPEHPIGRNWKVWLGYRRALEFDQVPDNQGVGQDNAALRADSRYLVGVVCDGVSQGFCGDIAATTLMEGLLERLWESRGQVPEETRFESWLIDIEAEMAAVVAAYPLSERIKPVIREKMEILKTTVGSQAVMCAFVLDRKTAGGLLNVYQVGDTCTYAYVRREPAVAPIDSSWHAVDTTQTDFSIFRLLSNPGGRVRSIGGSQHHLVHAALSDVAGIVLHTDGVPADWAASLSDTERPNTIPGDLKVWAGRDDASFLVALSPEIPTHLNNPPSERDITGVKEPFPPGEIIELPGVVEIDYHRGSRIFVESLQLSPGETARLISPEGLELETAGDYLYLIHRPGRNIGVGPVVIALSNDHRYTIQHSLVIGDPIRGPEFPTHLKGSQEIRQRRETSRIKATFYLPLAILLFLTILAGASIGSLVTRPRPSPGIVAHPPSERVPPVSMPTQQVPPARPWTPERLEAVEEQKVALKALRYDVRDFKSAIRKYQKNRGLSQTGTMGPKTRESLLKNIQALAKSKAQSLSGRAVKTQK